MTLEQFIKRFAEEFEETPMDQFSASTIFRDLEEWSSLTALSTIEMVDEEFEKKLTGADMRSCSSIEDLFNLINTK